MPDRAHIGLSPDYMIMFLCLLQLAAPRIGSAFIPTLMASLVGFAALAVAPFPSPKLTGWPIVGFCLFLMVLRRFFWPAIDSLRAGAAPDDAADRLIAINERFMRIVSWPPIDSATHQ